MTISDIHRTGTAFPGRRTGVGDLVGRIAATMIFEEVLLVDGPLKERARALTDRMAARLLPVAESPSHDWNPYGGGPGLGGASGLALAFAALAQTRDDERYRVALHAQLKRASTELATPDVSPTGGLSGVRAAAAYAQRVIPSYARLIERCDEYVDTLGPQRPEPAEYSTYDVISGWAGMRLCRGLRGVAPHDWIVEKLLATLRDDAQWLCGNPFTPEMGQHNVLGVAHGIAGVIAALSLTTDANSASDLVRSSAKRLADTWSDKDGGWPFSLQQTDAHPQYLGWCYGSVGIGAVLAATASWCGDDALLHQTRQRLERIAEHIDSPLSDAAICHGTMGAVLGFASAAVVTRSAALGTLAMRLAERAIDQLEASNGVSEARFTEGRPYDAYGYLDGSAGIILALCTLFEGADADWMRLHGLAPIR